MKTKTWKIYNRRALWLFNNDAGEGGEGGGGGGVVDPPVDVVEGTEGGAVDPPTGEETGIDWSTVVPEDLREKPWMKDILESEDPTGRFFKDMEGLQSKLGQRAEGAPKPDAPKEEWDKFYNSLGRPESPEGYDTPEMEWPEDMKDIGRFVDASQGADNAEYITRLKGIAHELGIPKEKFNEAYHKMNIAFVESNKEFFEQAAKAQQESQIEYAELMTKEFGDRAVQVQDNAAKIIKMVHGEGTGSKMLAAMSNEELVRLATVLDPIQKKYISEDTLNQKHTTPAFMSEEERRAEARKLMSHPAAEDFTHPEHEDINRRIQELYPRSK